MLYPGLLLENVMSVSTNNNTQVNNPQAATTNDKANTVDAPKKTAAVQVADAKNQLNAQIVKASLAVSISAKNDPLSLVYKTAIENLNEVLKPELGDNAIQNAANDEFTPEAVATRILSFVAGIYEMYRSQKRDDGASEEHNATLDRFMNLVGGGIDKGFKEARGILSGLNVLEGNIASNIDKTYELIQKGLADFAAIMKAPAPAAPTEQDATPPASESASDTVAKSGK